ncbi:uncharacterized protein MONOS_3312 [Monocercomonoides exilis]|uniref:uncharacterized protein n=1 Tax=Monocercomonoides exilis TaxID=2049356 RepID=UPI00355A2B31|nr:hypothetical protein MONOS_3312 [Monocercomonoides exilis]|eukprot:MONOS_3312.1-p1 / transcript=MONOS_3312.1 / gene=MONOS_3312 / organism=Monocercomonoides_exilis_PA203 / gene_product=unspecified product / transcript_product=unspecified product / location=Mono_scaffold00077:26484-27729(-) / protein_length=354 / sequence_SO=supercontig / SO=protein_coding / is_pseudo=false
MKRWMFLRLLANICLFFSLECEIIISCAGCNSPNINQVETSCFDGCSDFGEPPVSMLRREYICGDCVPHLEADCTGLCYAVRRGTECYDGPDIGYSDAFARNVHVPRGFDQYQAKRVPEYYGGVRGYSVPSQWFDPNEEFEDPYYDISPYDYYPYSSAPQPGTTRIVISTAPSQPSSPYQQCPTSPYSSYGQAPDWRSQQSPVAPPPSPTIISTPSSSSGTTIQTPSHTISILPSTSQTPSQPLPPPSSQYPSSYPYSSQDPRLSGYEAAYPSPSLSQSYQPQYPPVTILSSTPPTSQSYGRASEPKVILVGETDDGSTYDDGPATSIVTQSKTTRINLKAPQFQAKRRALTR